MNEEFVSYEIAKKLKEKGFREKCLHHYNNNGVLKENYSKCYCSANNIFTDNTVDAPTISQVLKWLREEKKIHICIDIYDDGWFFDVSSFYKADTGVYEMELPYKSSNVTPNYESYEQAAIAGVTYCLENLI